MGEQIPGGRTAAMLMIAEDMEEIRVLSGLVEELKRHLEGEKTARFNILAKLDADVADLEEQIANAQDALNETSERLDSTLKEMYFATPHPAEKKAKKGALEKFGEAMATLGDGFKPINDGGVQEATKTAEDLGLVVEDKPEPLTIEGIEKAFTDVLTRGTSIRSTFEPLNDPLGECELCQGWGVIEGELYGEPALVPCTCPAGDMVKDIEAGGDPQEADPIVEVCPGARECDDYLLFVANPGTQREGAATLVGVPCYLCGKQRPANCTGCPYRLDCDLDPETLDCREVYLEIKERAEETQEIKKTVLEPAAVVNDDEWPDLPEVQTAVVAISNEPSPLQLKCPHPKPFRKQIEGVGIVCEVCKLIIEPAPAAAKRPVCCSPQARMSDVDATTGVRTLSCVECGKIHRIQDKDGNDLPLDDPPPWKEEGPDMAPEARGDKAKSKKKTTAQE
jgi:hypothetical protein